MIFRTNFQTNFGGNFQIGSDSGYFGKEFQLIPKSAFLGRRFTNLLFSFFRLIFRRFISIAS